MFEHVELGEGIPGQHLAAPKESRENTGSLDSDSAACCPRRSTRPIRRVRVLPAGTSNAASPQRTRGSKNPTAEPAGALASRS